MELSEKDIELLDRFSRDKLSHDELKLLQERMKNPEFAAEVKSYFSALEVLKEAGRSEMRAMLAAIHTDVSNSNSIDKYKPGKSGGGWGFGKILTGLIIAGSVYFGYRYYGHDLHQYLNDKVLNPKADTMVVRTSKTDTVYHYKVVRDTVYRTTKKTKIIRQPSDTVGLGNSVIISADTQFWEVRPGGDTIK
jgi:hypothetical protein